MKTSPPWLCALLLCVATFAEAATYVIAPYTSGTYSKLDFFVPTEGTDYTGPGNTDATYNFGARTYPTYATDEWRRFHAFDLSSIPAGETVLSIRVTLPVSWSPFGGTFQFTTTSTPLAQLLLPGNNKVAEFNSLGTGTVLGTGAMPFPFPTTGGVMLDFAGTPEFVALLNQSRPADFVLSGKANGRSAVGSATLQIETNGVPEPGTMALLSGGMTLLLGRRRAAK